MSTWIRFNEFVLVAMICVSGVTAGCGDSDVKSPTTTEPSKEAGPTAPLIEKKVVADWCKEHGVPESICTRCNEGLIADFQKKGDWCKSHALPESQCLTCHPDLAAKFKAMEPKSGG